MIEITGLGKYYGTNKVLDDISIKINDGEIFGIIGHSGAGKSTVLRCINGLEKYQEGRLTVDSKEVSTMNQGDLRLLRKDLGMIFQHFSLLERRTVFENIALPMECFGISKSEIKKRVEELMEVVGISDKRDQKPRNLSGGQKQRVAIARALTMNPKVLLCDEATSALDPNTTKSILNLLKDINEKFNITIVMVTHQMEVIKQICSRVAIMEGGQILEMGDTEEIFLRNSEVLRKLLGEESIVLPDGYNLKIMFPSDKSNDAIITTMARKFDIDVSIVFGKLEKFKDEILGSLVINIDPSKEKIVKDFLEESGVMWEDLENEF